MKPRDLLLVLPIRHRTVARDQVVQALIRVPRHPRVGTRELQVFREGSLPEQFLEAHLVLTRSDECEQVAAVFGVDIEIKLVVEVYVERFDAGVAVGFEFLVL